MPFCTKHLPTIADFNFPKLEVIDLWLLRAYLFEGPWSSATAISSPLKQAVKNYFQLILSNF